MNSKIVLGSLFGDEGKGMTVDFLCNPNSLVIRFSGGQQCGHTIIRDGIKHVFSNFGSGTLKGCPTYFTEDTCIYPKTIEREYGVLRGKGVTPKLYISPFAKVTTPYDVWSGRAVEKTNRHGSCGLGIGSTMKRNEGPLKLFAIDLLAPRPFLERKIKAIKDSYNCDAPKEELEEFWEGIENPKFSIAKLNELEYEDYVFEGSQGILLDMDHGIFPNVTYANTTSKNALKYVKGDVEVFYVTRCYSTRHGNGWFEERPLDLINNEEEINTHNEWQGDFKVGEINYDLLRHAIKVDASFHGFKKNLVVTCLDQRPNLEFDYNFYNFNSVYTNNSPKAGAMTSVQTNNPDNTK